jgi:hypothetical protein
MVDSDGNLLVPADKLNMEQQVASQRYLFHGSQLRTPELLGMRKIIMAIVGLLMFCTACEEQTSWNLQHDGR